MLQINLFHEQQQIQREKDFDPVRLTIVGGVLIVLVIMVWALLIYLRTGNLRAELASNRSEMEKLKKELKDLEPLTDLAKIQAQAQALQNRMEYRPLFATQLDILRDVVPTNCQVRLLRTARSLKITETSIPGKKGPTLIRKASPSLDIIFEVSTRAKNKVAILQTRDNLIDLLHREPRFREWVHQTTDENDGANTWNQVSLVSSIAQDPKAGEMAIGIFEFKIPFALKDPPQEIP